jgi:hypothetical protein
MDIDALHSTLVSLTLLPEELRSARETLEQADSSGRAELLELLSSTERDLRIAKVALAREVGFEICVCCWPPEILSFHDDVPHCPGTSGEPADQSDRTSRFAPLDPAEAGAKPTELVVAGR